MKSDDFQRRPVEPQAEPVLSFFLWAWGAAVDDIPATAQGWGNPGGGGTGETGPPGPHKC